MNIYLSHHFIHTYKKITKKNKLVSIQAQEALRQFIQDPKTPSLRLHRLKGKQFDNWSISVSSNIRILFTYIKDGILLIDMGTHDEVYR